MFIWKWRKPVVIRLILYPFTRKTAMQSEKMKEVQPQLEKLEKKYKDKTSEEDQKMKATQISLLTTLFIKGAIPIWILAIVVLKEFCMVSGASFLYGKELVVSSKWYGKLATVLFYVAMVISLFLEQIGNTTNNIIKAIGIADTIIYYLAVITTIASLIMYMKAFYIQGYLKKNNEK